MYTTQFFFFVPCKEIPLFPKRFVKVPFKSISQINPKNVPCSLRINDHVPLFPQTPRGPSQVVRAASSDLWVENRTIYLSES